MKPDCIAIATLLLMLAALAGASPFRVGHPAPRLQLPSIADGAAVSLADFAGEKLVVHVWASW